MTRVLFLILNYKTYTDTIKVVYEILQECTEDSKILIVDNASPNDAYSNISEAFCGNERVEIIQSSINGGYAKGNNYGLKYAKRYDPQFVCIMNNDVHFTWDVIEKLCATYKQLEKPALIAPIQTLPNNKNAVFPNLIKVPNLIFDLRMNTMLFQPSKHKYESNTKWGNIQKVGYIPGALLFTEYATFEKLGFFDEDTFLFCEERFTGKTVAEAGLANYIVTDITYLHEHSKTINSEASAKRQRHFIHEGRILFYKRYSRIPIIAIFLLTLSFYFHEFEIYILSLIKK